MTKKLKGTAVRIAILLLATGLFGNIKEINKVKADAIINNPVCFDVTNPGEGETEDTPGEGDTEEPTSQEPDTEDPGQEECQHEYVETIVKATKEADGSIKQICSICAAEDEEKTVVIPKIESIVLEKDSYPYDGTVKAPAVKVLDSEAQEIDCKYYTVTYKGARKKVGVYGVEVAFADLYEGTYTEYFGIAPKEASIVTKKPAAGGAVLTYKSLGKRYTGVQIQCGLDSKFKNSKIIEFKKKSKKLNVKYLNVNTKYYIRIRTYFQNENGVVYSKWSKKVKVKTLDYDSLDVVSTDHQKYTYEEMVADIDELQNRYSDICHVNVIGQTADKRNLYEVIVGNPDAKKHFVVIANLHAREYMTVQLTMKQIEYYLYMYKGSIASMNVSDVCDQVAIHFVPSCNPDGTALCQSGFSAINNKKLRSKLMKMWGYSIKWKANARGIDLNRNWPVNFVVRGTTKGQDGYSGTKAASEKEVKALIAMLDRIEAEGGTINGIISYHAMGEVVYGKIAPSATKKVKKYTKKMDDIITKDTGYWITGTEEIDSNESREYFMYVRKIPAVTIEIGATDTPLAISQFPRAWSKNKDVVFKCAALFYKKSSTK